MTDHPSLPESAPSSEGLPAPEYAQEGGQDFPVVGIGASAGGLAAFEQFFTAMPPDPGVAFVVIQHLSPPHRSILPEIIQRFTAMPVSQVVNGIRVEPNRIYVIPPGNDMTLQDGRLVLLKPETRRGYRLPIDRFFSSLAQVKGEQAIGVVLSGTLNDGSLGLKVIKAEGGLTLAQDPETAEFEDMPRNAIATQDVDFILPPQAMGDLILKFVRHQIIEGYQRSHSELLIPAGGLQKLYYLLRTKTGHDFSLYKQNTILRRVERRMKICLVKDLEGYLDYLHNHPEEVDALFHEMLINVTHFFRDPEAFQALTEKAIRPLVTEKCAQRGTIRVWVGGCSSGEEAYSVAIVLREQMYEMKVMCKVQIFATDLDEIAIESARKGFFTDGSLENVDQDRLLRFFNPMDDGYQVKKDLRDMVVFSTQNLISDPPFSKIDLICCRNVLIYLESELQNQLLLQFHYSLNPEGFLFLGNSESVWGNSDLFSTLDRKYKLFRRKEAATQYRHKAKARFFPRSGAGRGLESGPSLSAGSLRDWVIWALLEYDTPACVVIDPKYDILFIQGRTGKYLEPVAGDINNNLVRMAREGLKTELATALHTAVEHKETVQRLGLRVKTNGDYQSINLTIRPFDVPPEFGELFMVVFDDLPAAPDESPETAPTRTAKKRREAQLERELREKDEYLNSVIDTLEETIQELKSSNEELQSSNEEIQSTNEELETSKEELQSINEELITINAELQNKNEELSGLNNDVYNLMSSTNIATIFLDLELRLRRYAPAVQPIYKFMPGDIGRRIDHFSSGLPYDHLVQDIQQVLDTLVPRSIKIQANGDVWYLVNIRPYRTLENLIDGAVITFEDISEQKNTEELHRLAAIVRDSNDAITLQDFQGRILAWNRGATQMYGWTEAEALKMNMFEMIPEAGQAETKALYERLSRGEEIRSYETQRITRDGRVLDVWMTLTALVDTANHAVSIATTERDITERKQATRKLVFENRALIAATQWFETLLETDDDRLASRTPLVDELCRMLVDEAGYRLVWMGTLDRRGRRSMVPVAWAGLEADRVKRLAQHSREMVEAALNSAEPLVMRNIPFDSAHKRWQAEARRHNYGSLVVLPLVHQTQTLGVVVIYATEPEAFLPDEVDKLAILAKSVAQVLSAVDKPPVERKG